MDKSLILPIFTAVLLLFILIMMVAIRKKSIGKAVPNYKVIFILGIIMFPMGLINGNPGFWGMGTIFFILGLKNKDKWGKETKWADLPADIKRLKLILIITLAVIVLGTAVTMVLIK